MKREEEGTVRVIEQYTEGILLTRKKHRRYEWFFCALNPDGVLLEILGGGVPPCSSNPDPVSDHKTCHFPHPF